MKHGIFLPAGLASLVTLAALAALGGCADQPTERGFEERYSVWVGKNINDFIAQAGPPARTFKAPDGNTIYTYRWREAYTAPITSTPTITNVVVTGQTTSIQTYGGQIYGGGTYQLSCTVDFTVNPAHQIVAWRHEGNNCKAPETPR